MVHRTAFVTIGKGLANHLQVPLPYLLYRAQVRYEEDLRGLQGVRESLSPTSPSAGPSAGPSITPIGRPTSRSGEYFPVTPDRITFPRRDSFRLGNGPLSASTSGRRLTIRTRLNSLGQRSLNSPLKVSSSSVITLQGPKRPHTHLHPLTPTSSRASPSSPASSADESEEDETALREAEEEVRARQVELDVKLRELQRKMTKEALGLVSSPSKRPTLRLQDPKGKGRETRSAPLSASSTSSSLHQRLEMSHQIPPSHTPSHHSLSSASSPQGSIPSIPSPEPRSPPLAPMRRFSPGGKSNSPPAVMLQHANRTRAVRSERGSEIGSETSSFSDLSGKSSETSVASYLQKCPRNRIVRLAGKCSYVEHIQYV